MTTSVAATNHVPTILTVGIQPNTGKNKNTEPKHQNHGAKAKNHNSKHNNREPKKTKYRNEARNHRNNVPELRKSNA